MKQLRQYQSKAIKESIEALETNKPVLLYASVGAGKSLMLAHILLEYEKQGKRCLCLINNAELVRGNAQAYIEEGGKAGIYCASLKRKDIKEPVIFASAQSAYSSLKKEIGQIKFDLIVVDEAHSIPYHNKKSTFMKLITRYYANNPSLRILGATGTPFRFKGNTIIGDDCLFKKQVGNISMMYLIGLGFLVEPKFHVEQDLILDFSNVKIKNGKFDSKGLEEVVENNTRLTKIICAQVVKIVEEKKRNGVFLFATTRKHAEEIYSYLPPDETGLILGDTPQAEREIILNKARNLELKYIVNISIVSVGIDVPAFDTVAYLRPTESMVLIIQTMGRALRLHPSKSDALVLDFAGNIERHSDWDDPILLKALKETRDKDEEYDIQCPQCQTMNTQNARRCIGENTSRIKRCDYFFEFKECEHCKAQNDIASRLCRKCGEELIDPNAKLRLLGEGVSKVKVNEMHMSLKILSEDKYKLNVKYRAESDGGALRVIDESYIVSSPKAQNFFYAKFIRPHFDKAYLIYPMIKDSEKIKTALNDVKIPKYIYIKKDANNHWNDSNWLVVDKDFC